jgi:ketopantoate hydroxymethyltransferase
MLGYSARVPRFVEKLADVPGVIAEAAGRYVESVRDRSYPAARHQYRMKGE